MKPKIQNMKLLTIKLMSADIDDTGFTTNIWSSLLSICRHTANWTTICLLGKDNYTVINLREGSETMLSRYM